MNGEPKSLELIEQLYHEYRAALLHRLYSIVGDTETAEDLLQETFIKALLHKDQLLTIEAKGSWLTRIAINTAYDHFRRQKRSVGIAPAGASTEAQLDQAPAQRPAEQPGSHELDAAIDIRAALDRLPAPKRLPLVLHYYGGYSLNDMALIMAVETGTVRSRLFRARKLFRQVYRS